MNVSVHDVTTQRSTLFDLVEDGEQIVIGAALTDEEADESSAPVLC